MEKIRIDKWLWVARFFKTRSIASNAIKNGKIHINKQRIKPSRQVSIGDCLDIQTSYTKLTIIVKGILAQRRPYKEASLLYEETAESIISRENIKENWRQKTAYRKPGEGRPTKKQQRLIHKFTRKG